MYEGCCGTEHKWFGTLLSAKGRPYIHCDVFSERKRCCRERIPPPPPPFHNPEALRMRIAEIILFVLSTLISEFPNARCPRWVFEIQKYFYKRIKMNNLSNIIVYIIYYTNIKDRVAAGKPIQWESARRFCSRLAVAQTQICIDNQPTPPTREMFIYGKMWGTNIRDIVA